MVALKTSLKSQLDAIATRVTKAEKAAEKQIRSAIKSSQSFRSQQLKKVQQLMKRAKGLKQNHLVKSAEKAARDLEIRATEGLDLLFTKLNFPTRKDLERLSKRVSQLQKRVDELEKPKHTRGSATSS